MTYTEKRLEEFDEMFPLFKSEEAIVFASRRRLKSFLSTSIAQAIAEERARVRGEIYKSVYGGQVGGSGYLIALDDLLSS